MWPSRFGTGIKYSSYKGSYDYSTYLYANQAHKLEMIAIKQGIENELESSSPSPLGAYNVIDGFLELAPWHVGIFVRERERTGIMGVSISLV